MSTHEARSGGQEFLPNRFDADWSGYDPNDLAAIQAGGQTMGFREDADTLYFARALDYVKAAVYVRPTPALSGEALVPTSTDTPIWAQSVTYRIYDEVGVAKIISNYADDLPRVDVFGREISVPVKTLGDSYGYTINDVRIAVRNGEGLDARRGVVARTAVERKENSLKLRGDVPYGLYGIINHPNIAVVVPGAGTWALPATTGDQIMADFGAMFDAIVNQSSGAHTPNVFGASQTQLSAMRSKKVSVTGETVATAINTQYPGINVVQAQEFKGRGTGGTDVVFMGERDIGNYYYDQVKAFEQYPPQPRGLEFVVPCDARTGGLVVINPLAMARMEGV